MNRWIVLMHTDQGFPLLLRWCPGSDTMENRRRFPVLAVITHTFSRRLPDGRPELEYHNSLADFDCDMVNLFGSPEAGVPVLVETFGGKRHYYFYTSVAPDVGGLMEKMVRIYPDERVDWEKEADAAWGFLDRYSKKYLRPEKADFPDDENGDALRLMQTAGDDLSVPRDVRFSFAFERQEDAENFAKTAVQREMRAKASVYPERKMWQAEVTVFMVPTYAGICFWEKRLTDFAAEYFGEADGWGSFAQAQQGQEPPVAVREGGWWKWLSPTRVGKFLLRRLGLGGRGAE